MGSTGARRLAQVSVGAFVVALLTAVLSALFVPPYAEDTLCIGTSADGSSMSCTTSTTGSEVPGDVASAALGLALLVSLVALIAAVVVAVRADVRARRMWHESETDGPPPASAARALLVGAVACLVLGLLGTLAASWLADGAFTFPVLRPPQFGDLTRLGLEQVRVGIALSLGIGALVLQWIGVLLVLGAGIDAAAVALAGRRGGASPPMTPAEGPISR
jgi:hypothetical protein